MGQLIGTLIGVVVAIAITLGVFVGANLVIDRATTQFRLFTGVVGAVVGALVGAIANSGGWFLGGGFWPLGGAVVGALVGALVWGGRKRSREQRLRTAERFRPVVFLFPALAFLGIVLVVPMLRTMYLSFRSARGEESVGVDNYADVLGNDRIFTIGGLADIFTSRLFLVALVLAVVALGVTFVRGSTSRRGVDLSAPLPVISMTTAGTLFVLAALGAVGGIVIWNNLFWVAFVTGISTVFGLAIAVLADRAKGESVAKSLIFMPMAISFVGASIIWRFVYAYQPEGRDQIGILNALWVAGGGEPQTWLQETPWNNLFLIAIMIWIQTGFAMVVLSSAIKGVPEDLLEAARVDGASEAQSFWRITIPHIRSTIVVVVTTLVITVLKVYDIVKVMTNGEFGTSVIANEMFDQAFRGRDYGTGSALAVILLIAVFPLMIVNARRVRRGEEA